MKNYQITSEQLLDYLQRERPELNRENIGRAVVFAEKAHKDQKRKSGEDYIMHPLSVAVILSKMQADEATMIAGILHDVLEDSDFTDQDLVQQFGEEVLQLVDGVTKLHRYTYHSEHRRQDDQADNYRKLLVAMTRDLRVLLIKLADRLHNMHTLQYKDPDSQKRIARETLDIYAPLANRFGLTKIQNELEDLSLKYLDPVEYKSIALFLNETKAERTEYVQRLLPTLNEIFRENEIPARITGRAKHLYSIYRKRLFRKVPYSEIYDFVGIRVLVETIDQCYFSLALIHSLFEPTEKRLKDYIARPKPNGYRSLHTIVIGPDNRKVEFQIRTHEMHLYAEEGIAAHWRYKAETCDGKKSNSEMDQPENLAWLKDFLNKRLSGSEEFLDLLRAKLQLNCIVAVTPQNDYIKLPLQATPLDFAFAVHTEVGLRCIGARVNGKMVTLRTILNDGDQVDIITSSTANPSKDWMQILISPHARQKLGNFLRRKEREDAVRLGKEIFERRCRKLHWKFKTDEEIHEISKAVKINDKTTLFYQLGTGKLLFSQIKTAVQQTQQPQEKSVKESHSETGSSTQIGIILGEVNSLMINYAACCRPLPGDDVIGYITRGRGISIHKAGCDNPSFRYQCEKEPDRVMPVHWDLPDKNDTAKKFPIQISISGIKRNRMMFDILGIFARYQIPATELKREIKGQNITLNYRLLLNYPEEYDRLYRQLIKIQGIHQIIKNH